MNNKYMNEYDKELSLLHQYLFLEGEIEKCKGGISGFTDKDCYDYYILCNNLDPYGTQNRVSNAILEHYKDYLQKLKKVGWETVEERDSLSEELNKIFFKHPNHIFIVRVLLKIYKLR